jgi:hypothetical protein
MPAHDLPTMIHFLKINNASLKNNFAVYNTANARISSATTRERAEALHHDEILNLRAVGDHMKKIFFSYRMFFAILYP